MAATAPENAAAEPETTGFGGASRVVKGVLELELTASEVPLPPDVAVCTLAMLPPDTADLPSFIEMIAEPDSNRLLHGLWSIRKLYLSMSASDRHPISSTAGIWPAMKTLLAAISSNVHSEQIIAAIFETIRALLWDRHTRDMLFDGIEKAVSWAEEIWPAMKPLLVAVSSNVLHSEPIIAAIFETICALPMERETRDMLLDVDGTGDICIGKAVSWAVGQAQKDRTLKMAAAVSHKVVGLKPYPSLEKTQNILESLAELVRKVSEGKQAFSECIKETLIKAYLAVKYITSESQLRITALLQTDLLSHAVELLHRCDDPKMQLPALCVIGNVVTGSDEQTQVAMDSGFFSFMGPLVRSQDRALRKEAVWILSNIVAGTVHEIQAVIDSGLLAIAVQESLADREWAVRDWAVWILKNISLHGTTEQIASVVQTYPVLDKLREAMNVFSEPHSLTRAKKKVILLVLETLTALFHQNSSWRVDFDSSWIERFEELDDHTSCQKLHDYIEMVEQRSDDVGGHWGELGDDCLEYEY